MKVFSFARIRLAILFAILFISNGYCNQEDSLSKVIRDSENNFTKINNLNELTQLHMSNMKYEKAIETSTECLNISLWENYSKGTISAYRNLGHAYYFVNNYVKALENYLYAIRYLEKTSNYALLAKTYGNIAIIYNVLKKPKEAIRYNKLCLNYLNRHPDIDVLLDCYVNFSDSYGLLKDHEKEIGYLKKVLEIRKKNNELNKLGIEYNNLGGAFWKARMFDSALISFTKYLDLSVRFEDTLGMARAYTNLGITYASKGEVGKSIEFYNKSLKLNTASNNYNYTYIQLIYAHLLLKNLNKAEHFFYLAKKEKASLKDLLKASDSIRKKYESLGDLANAYHYSKVRDSISTISKTNLEANVKLQYEVDGIEARLAEKENFALMQENLELRSQQNKFLIAILLLIFTIGIGGVYLFRKRLKEREKRLVFVEEGVAEMGKVLEDIKALRSEKKAFS